MKLDVVDLTLQLCQIPSVTGDEIAISSFLEKLLKDLGFEVQRQQVGDVKGRDNIYACWPDTEPHVIFSTHIDVVPPYFPPSRDGKWLIGRGVCDAKGIAAAMICASQQLVMNEIKSIGLLFVVGEEASSDGAKAAATFVPKAKYLVNGEPTDLRLVSGMKGAVVFELQTQGKLGHSAYPDSGKSAVHILAEDITRIVGHKWPSDNTFGATTVNIGTIEGGRAANVIADTANAVGIVRCSVDAASICETLKSLLSDETQLLIKSQSSPQKLGVAEGFDTCVVAFGSDVPYLRTIGQPYLIGPGSILEAHTEHEKVSIEELKQAVTVYTTLAQKLLGEQYV